MKRILLGVEVEEDGDDDTESGDGGNLITRADQRGEENRMRRWTKNIAMDLFPAVFIAEISFLNSNRSSPHHLLLLALTISSKSSSLP